MTDMEKSRRNFLRYAAGATSGLVMANGSGVFAAEKRSMKIGIIGAGKIGGALGEHWVRAGHKVLLSSRHPEELQDLAKKLGPRARTGLPREAAAFGEVILVSVPYAALPQIGRDYAAELNGKVVLDTCNPFPGRDGEMADTARAKGAGIASAEFLPGTRLVRAFNALPHGALVGEAHRAGERIGIPLAADDRDALAIAARLVEDAGFAPVVVGTLASAKEFDAGTDVFGRALTARELRQALGIAKQKSETGVRGSSQGTNPISLK
jgi:predicted dinucleotide-binding enzyme